MAKAWTDKAEYKKLSAGLANADRHEYFYRAKPLLQMLWSNVQEYHADGRQRISSQDSRLFLVNQDNVTSVVQLTYFSDQTNRNIDENEGNICTQYVALFEISKISVSHYLLIHNRDGRDNAFRAKAQHSLDRLLEKKLADHASIWSRELFLREVFNRMKSHVVSMLPSLNKYTIDSATDLDIESNDIIHEVPVSISSLTVNPYHLVNSVPRRGGIMDMAIELTKKDREQTRMSVLIGHAGYGKSTTALRAIHTSQSVLYVHATQISPDTSSTKQLLANLIDLEKLADYFKLNSEDDQHTLQLIVRPVLEYILKDEDTNATVIFDGLDEAALLTRRGGIQHLFNLLKDTQVPIILIARAEFWRMRLKEFETEFGMRGTKKLTTNKVNLYELLPWTDDIMQQLAIRYRGRYKSVDPAWKRLTHFIELVNSGNYKTLYGDIPQRPLFLKFILETVVESDIRKIGRAALFAQWAQMKIMRDVRLGQRDPILPSEASETDIVQLAFDIMSLAAFLMTHFDPETSTLELLNSIVITKLRTADLRFKDLDATSLFLKSLLVPTAAPKPGMPVDIRFGHRAYQEYFLARHMVMFPNCVSTPVSLPDGLSEWVRDIRNEMK